MKDHEIRPMLDRQLSACEWTAEDTQKLFRRMRKEKPCMKRKLSLAFVMMLLLLLAAGIALAAAGFGLLDSIMADDTITEVMINGPDHIFIEQNGRLFRMNKKFESQRRLEDVIQRIVGMAGREVNQANPICDTRLPDGSRVNVVLPPIAL